MSSNQSVETSLIVNKGVVDLSSPCGGATEINSNSTRSNCEGEMVTKSVGLKNTEFKQNVSCRMENVNERCSAETESSLCYEKMNGFTTRIDNLDEANHEDLVNGDAKCVHGDDKKLSKALKDNAEEDKICNNQCLTNTEIDLDNQSSGQQIEDTILKDGSDGHSVEELIDKLASTPLSFKEDTDQLSLLSSQDVILGISYVIYESEKQMPDIIRLITKDLSEPYSIYTYRYFIHNWPKLCFLAMDNETCVGAIVCKLDVHKKMVRRGYIAMLAVDSGYRRRKIGSTLVTKAIHAMIRDDCDEVVLETEITNQAALHLYENLGFVRDKRLFRYYLNGVDALRLKLWLR